MIPISICAIMKNEEKHIDEFLSSIEKCMGNYPHEILLTDTGSDDRTVELASKYNVKISFFDWINDFSAARNYSLSQASYKYVLVLDADEYMESFDFDAVVSWASSHADSLGMIEIKNVGNGSGSMTSCDFVPRFFNRDNFHYEGIVHEQPVSTAGHEALRMKLPISVRHVGYSGTAEEMTRKAERNIELLKKMPGAGNDPYILFQIGQSYYVEKKFDEACDYFKKALEFDLDTKLDYVRTMVVSNGYALLECGKTDEALGYENIYEEFADYPEFVLMMGSIYLKAGLLENAVDEFFKATTFKTAATEGVNTFIPLYNLGIINEVLGNTEDAVELFRKCGDYGPARERIEEITSS